MERRRAEVEGAVSRRRFRRLWRIAGATTLTAAAVGALFTPALDVDRVEVRGVAEPVAQSVREAAGITTGQALVGVDPAETRARLESVPWVSHASVHLAWPNRVLISITPHRPMALLAQGDGAPDRVLSATAELLTPADAAAASTAAGADPAASPERVVRIAALDGADDPTLLRAVALLGSLGPAGAANLGDLRVTDQGDLSFSGRGAVQGAEVVLGQPESLPEKLQALESMLGGAVDLDCLERLDVSVPERIIVRRSPGCTTAATTEDR